MVNKPELPQGRVVAGLADWVWPESRDTSSYTPEEWRTLAVLAAEGLQDLLGPGFRLDWKDGVFDIGGFSVAVGVGEEAPYGVSWRGVFGGTSWAGNGAYLSVSLFAYVCGKRVAPEGHSHVELVYVRVVPEGGWTNEGWQVDEHDEFGFYDEQPPLPTERAGTLTTTSTKS